MEDSLRCDPAIKSGGFRRRGLFVVIVAAMLDFTPDSITEVIIAGNPKTNWVITKCGPHMLGEFG